jgi:hypothetical protein
MDAFEQLAADIFWSEGYWVRTGVKVDLTREDKARIGRQSSPRWEIDLVAYRPATSELLALECKSYLDSGGVHAAHFLAGSKYAHRYKLFHDETLRDTVLGRLRQQFVDGGLCPADATVKLGLIHGHATAHNAGLLAPLFAAKDWLLFGPEWLRGQLTRMAGGGYENNTAAIVAKLLLRGGVAPPVKAIARPRPATILSEVVACH